PIRPSVFFRDLNVDPFIAYISRSFVVLKGGNLPGRCIDIIKCLVIRSPGKPVGYGYTFNLFGDRSVFVNQVKAAFTIFKTMRHGAGPKPALGVAFTLVKTVVA